MAKLIYSEEKQALLLKRFNDRESSAFGEVYLLYANELLYFTRRIYSETDVVANDVIHDLFIKIWESDKLKFSSLSNIKGYLLVSTKNYFRDYIKHHKCIGKFNQALLNDEDAFVSQVVENETFSIISQALELLPMECARVFKLCIEGWEVKEIAEKLNKTPSTVYKQKQEAISILKEKLPKDKLFILTFFYF